MSDARLIRNRILKNFELATQQATSEEERKRLLHFVIVGGGPTGVEFGAEFYDFLKQVQLYLTQYYWNNRSSYLYGHKFSQSNLQMIER